MKRLIINSIALVFLSGSLLAQSEVEALRYSQHFFGGTARSIGMAGAFGALGGDFISASLNPAGIGVYRGNELTVTPAILLDQTDTRYLGGNSPDSRTVFALNNLGMIYSNLTGKDEGWVSFNFGVGYNTLNNFNRNTLMRGTMVQGASSSSSLLDNFTNYANSTPDAWQDPDLLDPFYERLAYRTDAMPLDTLGYFWNDIENANYGQDQRRRIMEYGSIGEYAFTFGANYGNRLYFGATFGIHRLRYDYVMDHRESDPSNSIAYFDAFRFREDLRTRGTGYTFKAGIIYRPVSQIRVGAAFHLPTYYRIRETFFTDFEFNVDPGEQVSSAHERSPINDFDYRLRTPFKAIGSVAVQLGKIAMISADYEYTDYRNANYNSPAADFNLLDQNERIDAVYRATHNLRAGAELHGGPLYVRGGAAYYASPFQPSEVNHESSVITLNGGLGFRSRHVFFDLAYARKMQDYRYYLYLPEDENGASVSSVRNKFVATLGFRF